MHKLIACGLVSLVVCSSSASAVKRRAFATSVTGTANLSTWPDDGGLTGLDAGNKICQNRAAAVEPALPNPTSYRAWLSTTTTDAYCNVQGLTGTKAGSCNLQSTGVGGPWYLVDGVTPMTGTLTELVTENRVYSPVIYNEYGLDVGAPNYWTGTNPDGTVASDRDCGGWVTAGSEDPAVLGAVDGGSRLWTSGTTDDCNTSQRLLCLEIGASEPVKIEWEPAAIAFVTSVDGNADLDAWPEGQPETQGLSSWQAADAICRKLAALAHLPSPTSYVAWLSGETVSFADRFNGSGPFRRIDSVRVASSLNTLEAVGPEHGLYVDEYGDYIGSYTQAWTGTLADGRRSNQHCEDWSSLEPLDGATKGWVGMGRSELWTDNYISNCPMQHVLYCFGETVVLFWDGFDLTGDPSRWSTVVP